MNKFQLKMTQQNVFQEFLIMYGNIKVSKTSNAVNSLNRGVSRNFSRGCSKFFFEWTEKFFGVDLEFFLQKSLAI